MIRIIAVVICGQIEDKGEGNKQQQLIGVTFLDA